MRRRNGRFESRRRGPAMSSGNPDEGRISRIAHRPCGLERGDGGATGNLVPALLESHGRAHPAILAARVVRWAPMASFWDGRAVLVTGGNGFLGQVVVRRLVERGAVVVAPTHDEHDLTVPGVCEAMLERHRPSHLIHLAARVGGIGYNQAEPASLYLDNLLMGTHVIEAARVVGVDKTVLLGTVCSYPKFTPVPFQESSFWDGYPEETNAPYGIA